MNSRSVLVYEWFVATGNQWRHPGELPLGHPRTPSGNRSTLAREGACMLNAVAQDILQLDGWTVHTLVDASARKLIDPRIRQEVSRLDASQLQQCLRLLKQCDGIIVIAPETSGILMALVDEIFQISPEKLHSPDPEFVAVASSKWKTRQLLFQQGVPVVPTVLVEGSLPANSPFPMPCLLKPDDGAGSQKIYPIYDPSDWMRAVEGNPKAVCQPWVPGLAASVSIIGGVVPFQMPPVQQVFSQHPLGTFQSGRLLQSKELVQRAAQLANQVCSAMPATRGYYGIDIILGTSTDGSRDWVVEINPRLTTSYVQLREHVAINLASKMFQGLPPHCD